MEQTLILGFAFGMAGASTLIWCVLLLRGHVRVPPGSLLAITRSARPASAGWPIGFVRSGHALVLPFFQRGQLYPADFPEIHLLSLRIAGAGRTPVDGALTLRVKLDKDPEQMIRFVQTLGSRDQVEIAGILGRIARNGAIQVLGLLPSDRILSDPEQTTGAVRKHLQEDFRRLGLKIAELSLVCRPLPGAAHAAEETEFSLDGLLDRRSGP